ncbi:protein NDRG3-like isoform X1 [Pieris brassicae]|uniref:protein NDRG3-like isoform X1 n=1 Tax=Pieris brassicae TaxID=7116 RepID=UPI001E66104D|nr:protein NDRG3-like isoform X1 [Pieris brassicae]
MDNFGFVRDESYFENFVEKFRRGSPIVEIQNIQRGELPSTRRFSKHLCFELHINTDRGRILVAVQGDTMKPAIVTYHDLGLNYLSFESFFNHEDMQDILDNFCVYHMNAPGQEEGAATLPENYTYPTLDELASQIKYVQARFGFKTFIGLGVGAGANILARYAINNPSKMEGLALINCTSTQLGWLDWAYFKMTCRMMRRRGMCESAVEFLLWHHFGRIPEECNPNVVSKYRYQFANIPNPVNVAMFIDVFGKRQDLRLSRDSATMQIPVLNIVGALSPFVDATVTFNSRLEPSMSAWMKISDSSMVLEEEPGKAAEAFRLFLQGEGYVSPIPKKILLPRNDSIHSGDRRSCRHSPVIRITENPISEAVAC